MTRAKALLPLFLDVAGRRVLLVGGGPVAATKLATLLAARARVTLVSPALAAETARLARRARVTVRRRRFRAADLRGAWLAVAAAPPAVNRAVRKAAEVRAIFVNAVDDPASASAYMGGIVRRAGITLAVSTGGTAPALAGILRERLDAWLPEAATLRTWTRAAARLRRAWKRAGTPMPERRPALRRALAGAPRKRS